MSRALETASLALGLAVVLWWALVYLLARALGPIGRRPQAWAWSRLDAELTPLGSLR